MALICIGSVCFSLLHVGAIILFILNYFYAHFKKYLPEFLTGGQEKGKQIEEALKCRQKNKDYSEGTYIDLEDGKKLSDVLNSTQNISAVVKFGATWCKPCNKIRRYFKNQIITYAVTLIDVDVDIHETLRDEHNIKVLPTLLFYVQIKNKWVLTERIEGSNQADIEKAFQKYSVLKES
ncbi:thioredoxin 3 [Plasmodium gonderi]|uniref:Thioredoxin 3 n=1 Tax=Plasmodium gonderi TaxID=77519 RepID=A0A1Y1JFV7_PLAGO|nr:thioredoxin 3 [Plasmodium gonderi]GAW80225.1 thioredoxin 3 [Plasmodium gonderi]